MPSLIICGASSIDDPDGSPIYEQTCVILQRSEYADIADDVSVVCLPACDQIFNTMLRCAHVALQLSTREGFEVKVTEALAKGIYNILLWFIIHSIYLFIYLNNL